MANDITFSMTYYGQIERLQYQLDFFRNSSRKLREHVTLQIINDGYNDAGLFESVSMDSARTNSCASHGIELVRTKLDPKPIKHDNAKKIAT